MLCVSRHALNQLLNLYIYIYIYCFSLVAHEEITPILIIDIYDTQGFLNLKIKS